MVNIYFIGTAGSGKSSLVYRFQEWMTLQGLDCITVNLDPGAEYIPYEPDVDIRDWVKVEEVMKEYALGPNGAQIVCADMMALNASELAEAIEKFKTPYVLIDTPGQMELFAFRQSANVIINTLGRQESFLVFLSDPALAKTPNGFVSTLLLCAVTHFRFDVPLLNVLSKADTLEEKELQAIEQWSSEPEALYSALTTEQMSASSVQSIELLKAMENVGMYNQVVPVSSEEPFGIEDIYNAIQQSMTGGEDLRSD
ncbi:MAG TPA: ATP/GTP-binding protein [Methanomassiliicoccales archaeon]|nr:ATP/GTP-binding protein [Methanomassiliicoccales archaeon]